MKGSFAGEVSMMITIGGVGSRTVERLRQLAGEDGAKALLLDFPHASYHDDDGLLKRLRTPSESSGLKELLDRLSGSIVFFYYSGHGAFAGDEPAVEIGEEITRGTVSRVFSEPDQLYKMTALGFERFVAEIYRGLGYQVTETPRSHDGGVDLYLVYNLHGMPQRFVVQCKYRELPKRKIGVGVARELLGTVVDKAVTAGVLVTNYLFSAATQRLFPSHSARLFGLDRDGLLSLMAMYLLATPI